MQNKKVCIIMSTYNGEKYVAEQIESILNQSYKNIEIYVRDDGSKDNTVEILKNYEVSGKIKLDIGNNIGFIDSFYTLLSNAPKSDYYAFCDQDDVWEENKIEWAVEELNKKENIKPTMYFSNYDFYDEDMKFKGHMKIFKRGPSFRNALIDCISLGISIVINEEAKKVMLRSGKENTCGHDWWAYIVCSGLGEVIYDTRSTVRYRRTGNNVSPGGNNFIKLQMYRLKKLFFGGYFRNIKNQFFQYRRFFYNQLSEENRKILDLFCNEKYTIKNTVKKVFYPKMFRQNLVDEIFLRIIFLIGKL